MNKEPIISVVIPCYNDGRFLSETLSHLQNQTFRDFEIIIVNDGSNDAETIAVLDDISISGKALVLHKENGKMSSARNHGVNQARGEFIAALDADDYFHPSFFEKALRILNTQPQTAVVTSYIQLFGTFTKVSKPRGGNENNFLFSNQCPACAMVRKSCWQAIGGYDENMIYGYEDWEFYIRITQKGWNIHVIKEKLLYYRQTEKSTHKTKTIPHREELIQYIVNKHSNWYLQKLVELINNEDVVYRKSRVSFQVITELLKNRLSNKYG